MATSGNTKNDIYTMKALYDVIKLNLLMKDRDLVHFIRTMNNNIRDDFKKIKASPNMSTTDIINRYENYTIVYMMVKSIMRNVKITNYTEKAREITNMLLTDELKIKNSEKPQSSTYDDEE